MKFKLLPSIDHIYQDAKKTLFRFPLSILAAIIGSSMAIYFVEMNVDPDDVIIAFKILMTMILAVPLLTAGQLFIERNKFPLNKKIITYLALLAVLVINYIFLPETNYPLEKNIYRYVLFGGSYYLLVTFAAYLIKNEVRGFWEFNKSIFVQLAKTALYTSVLFIGIAIALATIDYLFGVSIDEEVYGEIWIFIAGIIAPWLFLNGYPSNFKTLNAQTAYHKSIRIFGQYILTPLVVTYFAILYAYSAKILLEGQWPEGQVSYLIIFFALAGIATNLILYPIRQDKEQKWSIYFEKGFFISLIPMIGMLFYAIYQRLEQYGFTEDRYYVVLLGLWLLGISVYFIISKTRNIKHILISFAATVILSQFGPWSAYSISESSQITRLEWLLKSNNMLVENSDGTFTTNPAPEDITPENSRSIISIVRYLGYTHGFDNIQPWFEEDLQQKEPNTSRYTTINLINSTIFKVTEAPFFDPDSQAYFYFRSSQSLELNIQGYDYLLKTTNPTSETYQALYNDQNSTLTIINTKKDSSIAFNLADLANKLKNKYTTDTPYESEYSPEEMTLIQENETMKVKIHFTYLNAQITETETTVAPYAYSGTILIDEK